MEQLTDFEKHIKSHYQGADLTIFDRTHWLCQLVMMETNHNEEFELLVDSIVNSLDVEFVSEYFKSRVGRKYMFNKESDDRLIIAYRELVKETLDNIDDKDIPQSEPAYMRFIDV